MSRPAWARGVHALLLLLLLLLLCRARASPALAPAPLRCAAGCVLLFGTDGRKREEWMKPVWNELEAYCCTSLSWERASGGGLVRVHGPLAWLARGAEVAAVDATRRGTGLARALGLSGW